jgi:hypothetical protein
MMKRKILILLLAVLFLVPLIPGSAAAADALTVTGSSAQVNFPASITFSISARSDVNISDIRLRYTIERMEFATIISEVVVDFQPAKTVNANWVWDMRRTGGLPPGTGVNYWWTVEDSSGKSVETVPQKVVIQDNRYTWHTSQQGKVTLYWYKGDNSFAAQLMDAAQQALGKLSENSGAELNSAVSIYIYASADDLQGSMIFPQEWTGGVAFTEYGTVAIGIAPTASDIAWGKRAIAHELTHLVVHQVVFNPYNDLPVWLDEGLAMSSEGPLEDYFVSALSKAEKDNTLLSIRSLSSPFSAYSDVSILSYAESYEAVQYLINEYGRQKMYELLDTFRQGSGYDEALEKVYGFDMDALNMLWRTPSGANVL